MKKERIERNLALVARCRPERVYLRGAEWWYYQLQRGDDSYWQLARELFRGDY